MRHSKPSAQTKASPAKASTEPTPRPKLRQKQRRPKQPQLLASEKSAYGGELLKTRAGRQRARPLSTKETMHLVLRSTQARGDWSFRNARHAKAISRIVEKFSVTYGVRIISMANVGNHLHLQIKLSTRDTYNSFIRSITGAIAMAVTGRTRWSRRALGDRPADHTSETKTRTKFWDYRPYTRIVQSFRAYLKLKDYVHINELEGNGVARTDARFMIEVEKRHHPDS